VYSLTRRVGDRANHHVAAAAVFGPGHQHHGVGPVFGNRFAPGPGFVLPQEIVTDHQPRLWRDARDRPIPSGDRVRAGACPGIPFRVPLSGRRSVHAEALTLEEA
jgi:hypothetical protein